MESMLVGRLLKDLFRFEFQNGSLATFSVLLNRLKQHWFPYTSTPTDFFMVITFRYNILASSNAFRFVIVIRRIHPPTAEHIHDVAIHQLEKHAVESDTTSTNGTSCPRSRRYPKLSGVLHGETMKYWIYPMLILFDDVSVSCQIGRTVSVGGVCFSAVALPPHIRKFPSSIRMISVTPSEGFQTYTSNSTKLFASNVQVVETSCCIYRTGGGWILTYRAGLRRRSEQVLYVIANANHSIYGKREYCSRTTWATT